MWEGKSDPGGSTPLGGKAIDQYTKEKAAVQTAARATTVETSGFFDPHAAGIQKPHPGRSRPQTSKPADSGLYVLWLELPCPARTTAGSLGLVALPPGLYAYVGSAQRRRSARIARHLQPEKPLRWHIDYIRPHARVVAVSLVDGTRDGECRLAQQLTETLGARVAVPRFGASDCRCPGHLLLCPPGTSLERECLAFGELVRLA